MSAALAATLGGFAFCIATSLAWPLVTGGKAIVSLPPFVIVAFELSVLVGGLVNLAALAWLTVRGRRRRALPPHAAFSGDRIGIFVVGEDAAADALLREHGAEEVRRVA
jgi:molybdopterin-containing oxidoreductase family membrane subunit